MARQLKVSLGQSSRTGREKALNQDFHGAMLPREPLLTTKGVAVALADGISSSAVSHEASAAAVRSFLEDYYDTSEAWSVRRSAECVLAAVNAWLHAQTMHTDARFDKDRGYVCAFSALVVRGCEVHTFHVGDARIYRVHAQSLEQLTHDHRVHVSSAQSYLGRALGANPHVEIDYRCTPAEAGSLYLLATDGAYAYLDAQAVRDAVSPFANDLDAAAQALVEVVHARGAGDDMTVQLLRIDALPETAPHQLSALREELALPPLLAPRMQFEGYRVVRELHASARSHVYLAVDELTGQQVALKTPAVALSEHLEYLDRLLLEEWIARRIRSAHVVRPVAEDRPRRHVYAAMEFVEGLTLAQWMVDHPRPALGAVRDIIAQVAKGLHAFHLKEMLHRDLRPENIMIDTTGTARIIDFGATWIAGLAPSVPGPVTEQAVEGTLQYTAPECFLGDVGTSRSDLFSLAVLTYQMLTAQLPYGLQVVRIRSSADLKGLRYVPVRHLRPDLPEWLDSVLHKALHPNPAKRQEAVSEFVHDLEAPGLQFHHPRRIPLAERNPVVFWQTIALVLALLVVALTGARVYGL